MDNQTFFTLLLGFGFAVALGVAIYAMSIPIIEPKLAKRAAQAAWFFGIALCVWYGGTNDMRKTFRYSIAVGCSTALTLMLCVSLDYIKNKAGGDPHATLVTPPKSKAELRPLTMREIFDSDFAGVAKIFTIQKCSSDLNEYYSFPATEYIDIYTNSYYLAFFISSSQPSVKIANIIAQLPAAISRNLGQVEIEVTSAGSGRTFRNSTMNFSKQIYLYFESPLNSRERFEIETEYSKLGLEVTLFDYTYGTLHGKEFERVPHGATEGAPIGAQLPSVPAGTLVKVRNQTGTLPPVTTVVPDLPLPTPTPPQQLEKK